MRKRPILLAASALAAGLAALGTVVAQQPPGGAGAAKVPPPANVRPYSNWAPPPADAAVKQAGYLQPAGGPPAKPRLTNPVTAGPDGVRPVSAELPPPPNLEIPPLPGTAAAPPAPPAGTLPPPSVSLDPVPVPAAGPAAPALPAGVTPVPLPAPPETKPAVPVPPAGGAPAGGVPPVPPLPLPGVGGPAPLPAGVAPLPPAPGLGAGVGVMPAPATTPVRTPGLSSRATSSLTVEAVCPETVVFGQEFRYEIVVRNTGTSAVSGVRVEDEVPAAAKYVGSDPPAEQSGDRLTWAVGDIEAGAEKRLAVRLNPHDEGEVRSKATVSFASAVEARTKVTRPRIALTVTGPETCKVGEEPVFQIKVTNSGTGPAQKIVLRAKLSEGLAHPHLHPPEMMIEATLAALPPGETRTIPLQQVAAGKAGAQWCQVTVAVPGCADATAKAAVTVVEPLLQVVQTGPAKCLVRAEPSYEITLSNPGTAATDPVALYTVLPEGFDYVSATENGTFSAANRVVVWKLAGLAPGGTKGVTLKLRAAAAGDGMLRTIAQTIPDQPVVGAAGGVPAKPAGRALESKAETALKAEGVAAVRFEVIDLDDPVEVGKEAIYEVRVTNQGTGACTNVQLVAAVAEGTEYKGSSGPTQIKAQGQHLVFEPIATLAAKGEAVYRIKVKGTTAGDLRFRVQMTCDQVRTPIVKEESTRFYKE